MRAGADAGHRGESTTVSQTQTIITWQAPNVPRLPARCVNGILTHPSSSRLCPSDPRICMFAVVMAMPSLQFSFQLWEMILLVRVSPGSLWDRADMVHGGILYVVIATSLWIGCD